MEPFQTFRGLVELIKQMPSSENIFERNCSEKNLLYHCLMGRKRWKSNCNQHALIKTKSIDQILESESSIQVSKIPLSKIDLEM